MRLVQADNVLKRIAAFTALFMAVGCWIGYLYSQRIKTEMAEQCVEYLVEITDNNASALDAIYTGCAKDISVLAHEIGRTIDQEPMTGARVNQLTNLSDFDKMEYMDASGISVDMRNRKWNVTMDYAFKDGMRGKSGVSDVDYNIGDVGRHVIAYAPVITPQGTIRGVLMGYYADATLYKTLNTKFWGYRSCSFICNHSGTILSAGVQVGHNKTAMDYFTKNGLLDEAGANQLATALYEGKNLTFTYKGNYGDSYGRVTAIGTTGYLLLETFPSETIRDMTAGVNGVTVHFYILALAAMIIYMMAVYRIIKVHSEHLEEENRQINNVLEGTEKLYDYFITVDLEHNTYERFNANLSELSSSSEQPIQLFSKGRYTDMINCFEGCYAYGDPNRPMTRIMEVSSILDAMSNGKDTLNYRLSAGEKGDEWYVMYVACIERRKDIPNRILITMRNITSIMQSYLLEKRIPKLLYDSTYAIVCIVDIKSDDCHVLENRFGHNWALQDGRSAHIKFKEVCDIEREHWVLPEYKEVYAENTDLEKVVQELETTDRFEFYFNHRKEDGDVLYLKQRYQYMDSSREKLLVVVDNITEQASRDALTGAYSMQGFARNVGNQLKQYPYESFSILYFDIQQFKAANSIMGYEYGNVILRQFADALRHSKLNPVCVGRASADHFVVLIHTRELDFYELKQLSRLNVSNTEHDMRMLVHCGIYHLSGEDGGIRDMVDKARLAEASIHNDYAMPYAVYQPDMGTSYVERAELMNSLSEAFAKGQFTAYYQPVYDGHTREIVSAEALVRWNHPQKGLVPPNVFIPLLEENGFVSKVDMLVSGQVQRFLCDRLAKGQRVVPISINLSRMDLANDTMLNQLLKAVQQTNLEGSLLRFEITESSMATASPLANQVLEQLHALGCLIMIDDFGTGQSSLDKLPGFSFDYIKLDMSFIRNIGKNSKSEAIIKATILMAHQMQAEVIAEGVETAAQLQFLLDQGCRYIQGYYFSKPVTSQEFESLLDV